MAAKTTVPLWLQLPDHVPPLIKSHHAVKLVSAQPALGRALCVYLAPIHAHMPCGHALHTVGKLAAPSIHSRGGLGIKHSTYKRYIIVMRRVSDSPALDLHSASLTLLWFIQL